MKQESKVKLWNVLMDLGHLCGCHQKPERSFFYHRFQLPFCSRCLGIIIGELLVGPFLLLLNVNLRFYSLLLFIPLLIDGSLQYYTRYESNNNRRLVTGILAGVSVTMFLFYLVKIIFF